MDGYAAPTSLFWSFFVVKHLTSVKSTRTASFVYTPPPAAYDAVRVILKPDLPRVSYDVLGKVLRGVRRANLGGRILIITGLSLGDVLDDETLLNLIDENTQVIPAGRLPEQPYPNRLPDGVASVLAPALLSEVDCRLSLTAYPAGLLDNLTDLIPGGPDGITQQDLFFSLGHIFDGAIVTTADHIAWGDDPLAVDEAACALSGQPVPPILKTLRALAAD